MTGVVVALLVGAIAVAAANWFAVGTGNTTLEYVAKPGTMVLLIGVAVALEDVPSAARTWFVVALVLSLAGDVLLMLPQDLFVFGLGSFLLGHLAYIAGLWSGDTSTVGLAVGIGVVAVLLPLLATRILRAVRASEEPELAVPVAVYIAVITGMVVSAGASGSVVAFGGALLFYASDATIAWTRFIRDYSWGRVAIMVTYHLAQIGLVLSLV